MAAPKLDIDTDMNHFTYMNVKVLYCNFQFVPTENLHVGQQRYEHENSGDFIEFFPRPSTPVDKRYVTLMLTNGAVEIRWPATFWPAMKAAMDNCKADQSAGQKRRRTDTNLSSLF